MHCQVWEVFFGKTFETSWYLRQLKDTFQPIGCELVNCHFTLSISWFKKVITPPDKALHESNLSFPGF